MNNKAEALMPCPFCGGTDIYISSSRVSDMSIHRVACSTCPAMTESMIDGYDEVIKAWNTRDDSHLKQKIRTATLDEVKECSENVKALPKAGTEAYEDGFLDCANYIIKTIDSLRGKSD